MHVRSSIRIEPLYLHDCDRCVLVGHHHGQGKKDGWEDVYLCVPAGGGHGSLIHRHSDEGSDYSSVPLAFEGEPDPTRKRLPFPTIRTIEHALSFVSMFYRAYEEIAEDDEPQVSQAEVRILLDRLSPFLVSHLPGEMFGRTHEEIRQVEYHFDTDIGNRWPVIYAPHEHTPAPED